MDPKSHSAATSVRFGFPKLDNHLLSHWLESAQDDPLLNHRTTTELPRSADIVIVGSGLSGTLIAKCCIETWPEKHIVVIEAREFCSGATGRNAGHCKPDQWRGYAEFENDFGSEQALKNEQETWAKLVSYVRENNIDCDLWVGDTFDVPITSEAAEIARDSFERFKVAGGNVDHVQVTNDPAEAEKISRVKDAKACYAWPASTLHPWKLTAHIMRKNLDNGVQLHTRTMATSIIPSSSFVGKWVVKTGRGDIETSQVVHATNAYSSALEPSLRGLISPTPHMCNKVNPPVTFVGEKALKNSYGILLSQGGLITINPRAHTGPMLFGGSNPGQVELMKWLYKNPARCTDDDIAGFKSVTDAAQQFASSQLRGWTAANVDQDKIFDRSWSGIIGLSTDSVPFVGELPKLPGQWICAGHHGHGMARIFTAAPGLVKLMNGVSWTDINLPEVFRVSESRMERLKEAFLSGDGSVRSRL